MPVVHSLACYHSCIRTALAAIFHAALMLSAYSMLVALLSKACHPNPICMCLHLASHGVTLGMRMMMRKALQMYLAFVKL
jgi:hypothetical protein